MEFLHVVYTRYDLSDNYTPYMASSMKSAIENSSLPIQFHIIHDDRLSSKNVKDTYENTQKLNELINDSNSIITYHIFHPPENMVGNCAYYRLFLPELLGNVDIAIVLGGDVIVNTDLAKLIHVIPKEYSLAGSIDYGIISKYKQSKTIQKFYKQYNIDVNSYICSDVAIYNLNNIRNNKKIPDKAIEFYNKNVKKIPLYEQDVLNYVFTNDKYILPQKFNLPIGLSEDKLESVLSEDINGEKISGYIIHFEGSIKPWEQHHSNYDIDFWHYLFMTPWGSEKELVKYLQKLLGIDNIILSMDNRLWGYNFRKKISCLWKLSLPLYLKLLRRYIKSIGH